MPTQFNSLWNGFQYFVLFSLKLVLYRSRTETFFLRTLALYWNWPTVCPWRTWALPLPYKGYFRYPFPKLCLLLSKCPEIHLCLVNTIDATDNDFVALEILALLLQYLFDLTNQAACDIVHICTEVNSRNKPLF